MDTSDHIDYNRIHDLTVEEVRACPMFADCTDEEAQEVIDTLKKFTVIVFHYHEKNSNKSLNK